MVIPLAAQTNSKVPEGLSTLRHLPLSRGLPPAPAAVSVAHSASSAPSRASTPRSTQFSAASAQSVVVQAVPIRRPASPLLHVWSPQSDAEHHAGQDFTNKSTLAKSPSRGCSPLWARPVTPLAPSTSPLVRTPQTAPAATQQTAKGMSERHNVRNLGSTVLIQQQRVNPTSHQHQSNSSTQQLRAVTPPGSRACTPGPTRGSPVRAQSEPVLAQQLPDAKEAAAVGVMAIDVDLASVRPGSAEAALAAAVPTAAGVAPAEPSSSARRPRRGDKPLVRVPEDHKAGQPIAIRTAAGLVLLPLPPGARPGDEIAFEVEALPPLLASYGGVRGPDGSDTDGGADSSSGDTESDVMTLCGTLPHGPALPNELPAAPQHHMLQAAASDMPAALLRSPSPPSLNPAARNLLPGQTPPPRSPAPPPALYAAGPSSLPRLERPLRVARGCDSGPCSPPPRSVPSPSPPQPSPVSKGPGSQCKQAAASVRAERGTALPPPLQVPQLGRLRVAPPPPPPPLSWAASPAPAQQVTSMYPESPLLDRRSLLHSPGAALTSALPPHSGPSSPPRAPRTVAAQEVQPAAQQPPVGHCASQAAAVAEPLAPTDMQLERAERQRLRVHRSTAAAAALDDEELLEELCRRQQLASRHLTSQSTSDTAAPGGTTPKQRSTPHRAPPCPVAVSRSSSSASPPASPLQPAMRCGSTASPRSCRDPEKRAEPENHPRARGSQLRCAGRTGAGAPPPPDVQEQAEEPQASAKDSMPAGQTPKGRGPGKLHSWPLNVGGSGRLPPPPNFSGAPSSHFDYRALQPPFSQPVDMDDFTLPSNAGPSGLSVGFDAAFCDRGFSGLAGLAPASAAARPQAPATSVSSVQGGSHKGAASWDLPAPPPQWLMGRPPQPVCMQSNANFIDVRTSPQHSGNSLRGCPEQALAAKLYHRFGLDGCISFEKFASQLAANKDPRASPACGGA